MLGLSHLERMVEQTVEADTCILQKLSHYIPII